MREGVPYFFKSTMAREHPKYDYRIADILRRDISRPYLLPAMQGARPGRVAGARVPLLH
ncbi:hypothetical protein DSO57_1009566 [Entomophthora muscae]|uniref:Uncharacterized protein n=1 Tax=Entomophthora muscae TaxID=34485 RepID=A0ACC2RXS5_9FUNG|nr:hypothetical protein DSO57_1009566 [Entomophthora muscae]